MSSKKNLDHFYHKAKQTGFKARSVYKLAEMDERYKLFKKNMRILDLGASPGSWMQYLIEKVGDQGKIVGFDLNPIKIELQAPHLFFQQSVLDLDLETLKQMSELKDFHAVVSDMAPKTTGNEFSDHIHSFDLCVKAYDLAEKILRPKGIFICKMFQGEHTKELLNRMGKQFEFSKVQKPDASRSESREVFLLATGFKASF